MPCVSTLLRRFVALPLVFACLACEPKGSQTTPPPPTDRPATSSPEAWTKVHIEDDPGNPTLSPCDNGSLRTPGADIDAAALFDGDPSAGGKLVGYLADCINSSPMSCENDAAQAADAEGEVDAHDESGFVSLNGGCLSCSFSGGVDARPGDFIQVFQRGGGAQTERYRIRLERASGGKSSPSPFASGGALPVVDLIL